MTLTMFIGVVDGTLQVAGVDSSTSERRDALDWQLRDFMRQSIQSPPDVVIDYLSQEGRTVVRTFVPDSPKRHSFDGRYYVPEGSQSRNLNNGEIGRL